MDTDRRSILATGVLLAATCALPLRAEPGRTDAQMRDDWPWLGRYAADNRSLLTAGTSVEIVFIGDSITEGWQAERPSFFSDGWICRGIGGQTSPQIVLRMMADVVALRPHCVHILAGTNDVAGNTGPMTAEATTDNIRAMITIAREARIVPILGGIPPASAFPWAPEAEPAARIVELNRRLWAIAQASKIPWIDYHAALEGSSSSMDMRYSADGVHPNAAGYTVMELLALPVIAESLVKSVKSC